MSQNMERRVGGDADFENIVHVKPGPKVNLTSEDKKNILRVESYKYA